MSDSNDTDQNTSDEGGSILDDGGIDTDERAGRSLGIEPEAKPDEETQKEIEGEREERLDPDNRPENAEVDNTPREFDVERGQFTDSEDYDESEPAPFSDPEDPNNSDNDSESSEATGGDGDNQDTSDTQDTGDSHED
jgi:hypothetical protein